MQQTSQKSNYREFPGGPVVRSRRSHCQGLDSIPCQGTKILQAARRSQNIYIYIYIYIYISELSKIKLQQAGVGDIIK